MPGPTTKQMSLEQTAYDGVSQIKMVNGKPALEYSPPADIQGYRLVMQFSRPNAEDYQATGPYRVVFVLGSEFVLHCSNQAIMQYNLDEGFSNLTISQQKKLKSIILKYKIKKTDPLKEATVQFNTSDKKTRIQSISITTPEIEFNDSLRMSTQFISMIMDSICFRHHVPILVRRVDIYESKTNYFMRRYATIPHVRTIDLVKEDVIMSQNVSHAINPLLRLYREALSSAKPQYRLLCFYRTWEGLVQVREKHNQQLTAKKIKPNRPRRKVQGNSLAKQFIPHLIGKPVQKLFEHVNSHYRVNAAHFNLDGFNRMILDPAYATIDQAVDAFSAVMQPTLCQLIQDEWDFVVRHKL